VCRGGMYSDEFVKQTVEKIKREARVAQLPSDAVIDGCVRLFFNAYQERIDALWHEYRETGDDVTYGRILEITELLGDS